ncbi:SubName: Full=Uncharacterized protein {ECO:0000313/EMBL:CCA66647.1} [Serendipita indica DSM 11827]|uniref:Mediator of RNA polymerase II transcription subunit 19 n=1 Tax=Serendipita indica (strain DSM 11827) TaxID=1109443 RepID=G4T5N4_SERID|nr:SubName: Full=Uncharacterized protein {ECO:0000313/EMBL:CCA66647.1} [Serendipita indica DSM 11827]CCA66647.1 hypothetical protein PIIN_00330 [Serendipita indica DSM 11827]
MASHAMASTSTATQKFPNIHHQAVQHPFMLPVLNVPDDPNYRRPAPINLTQDLVTRFGLFDAFQRQVVGHHKHQQQQQQQQASLLQQTRPGSSAHPSSGHPGPTASGSGVTGTTAPDDTIGAAKKEKKREKDLYKTLFNNLPGKQDTKRDRYLSELTLQPPKEGRIMLLDDALAEAAFTIFDIPQPVNEEEENKKRKKKRKREQEQQAAASIAPTPAHLPTPGGPPPLKQSISVKQEVDPSLSQRPMKRPRQVSHTLASPAAPLLSGMPCVSAAIDNRSSGFPFRQDNYPMPLQQPTPKA